MTQTPGSLKLALSTAALFASEATSGLIIKEVRELLGGDLNIATCNSFHNSSHPASSRCFPALPQPISDGSAGCGSTPMIRTPGSLKLVPSTAVFASEATLGLI